MMSTIHVGLAAAVAVAAAVVVYLTMREAARRRVADAAAQELQRQLSDAQRQLTERNAEIARLREDAAAAARDHQWLASEIEREKKALGTAEALLETSRRELRDAMKAVAAEALNANNATFLDLARSSFVALQKDAAGDLEARKKAFDGLVQPVLDTLKQVDLKLGEAERERATAYSRLADQVTALGASTTTLSRALRTPAVRGRWGEMQLRRVVEIAGMLQRCDFDEQPGVVTENGRLRPDLIVHLPAGKQLVVDAKAPLEAFLDAQDAPDEEARQQKLLAHARQVREHMDRLGGKAYWDQLQDSPEMVVMFLPGETLFSAALQSDLTLIEYGLQQRVLLASPITLIALLTTVAHSWRQEALAENYREVARLGKEFYDRLAKFADYFEDVRRKLDGAVQAYNAAAGSLEARVLVSARRLRDLNVTTAAELPPAETVDAVPRVPKHAGLMGLPEGAETEGPDVEDYVGT